MGRVHDLLLAEDWSKAELSQLVQNTLEPYNVDNRIEVDGPNLGLKPETGVTMAMVLHELATNAVKYGALSNASGHLLVSWGLEGLGDTQQVQLNWVETGGPPVTQPRTMGFGTSLIERSITQLGGTTVREFAAGGLSYKFIFPCQGNIPPPRSRAES